MEYEVQKHLHYAGIPSFNLYPVTRELKDDVDITIMGVPFDSGCNKIVLVQGLALEQ